MRFPAPRICIYSLIFWFLRLLLGIVPTGLRPRMAISDPPEDLVIGNPGAILRPRAVSVVAADIFGEPHVWVV